MINLWDKKIETEFFRKSLELTTPEKLFNQTFDNKYLAYWPKGYKRRKITLQSRNAFIGDFTEKWSLSILKYFADKIGAFIVQNVVCEEIDLKRNSPADLAFCKTNERIQEAENIIMIFEVKMSVVWNWEYFKNSGNLKCIGNYKTHQGNPGLLRSDTMLKAIGKSINIRVAGYKSTKIPIIILGNTPITSSYFKKVDNLKKFGIIQGFWSLNPEPLDKKETIKNTQKSGFIRIDSYKELVDHLNELFKEEQEFFSGMKTKNQIGKMIEIANKEENYENKAEKFLSLLRED